MRTHFQHPMQFGLTTIFRTMTFEDGASEGKTEEFFPTVPLLEEYSASEPFRASPPVESGVSEQETMRVERTRRAKTERLAGNIKKSVKDSGGVAKPDFDSMFDFRKDPRKSGDPFHSIGGDDGNCPRVPQGPPHACTFIAVVRLRAPDRNGAKSPDREGFPKPGFR